MTTAWIDLRGRKAEETTDIIKAAADFGIEAVVGDTTGAHPDGVQWVALDTGHGGGVNGHALNGAAVNGSVLNGADVHVHALGNGASGLTALRARDKKEGIFVDVTDADTLQAACTAVRNGHLTVIRFKDPTKIPLEIVLAAGSRRGAKIMTFVSDLAEAKVVMSVLESGPDGVIMSPRSAAEVEGLAQLCKSTRGQIELKEFTVTEIVDAGTGDRVCVDTCSNFMPDEGILIGSFGGSFLLCCSETHPLPYMPTRPFRVNAGAVSSYVLSNPERTNYLSELRQGHSVIGVRTNGETRPLVVGRCKIETRPLLLIRARSADGDTASMILQNDWHVRVLGRGGEVLNITELAAGSVVMGHTAARVARHVGMAVDEYCLEQ